MSNRLKLYCTLYNVVRDSACQPFQDLGVVILLTNPKIEDGGMYSLDVSLCYQNSSTSRSCINLLTQALNERYRSEDSDQTDILHS